LLVLARWLLARVLKDLLALVLKDLLDLPDLPVQLEPLELLDPLALLELLAREHSLQRGTMMLTCWSSAPGMAGAAPS
jgi:hypothetical protein